jgi:uncharacterized membrane protein HdeD (DUF308 family)
MSLNLKDIIENWKLMIIVSIISILFGIFIIAHPFTTIAILSAICGVALLIAEIINLIESIYICVKMKN